MKWSWHWQNLNERRDGEGHPFFHGRAWFRFGEREYPVQVEWVHGSKRFGITVDLDRDEGREILLQLSVPPVSYFVGFPGPRWLFDRLPFSFGRKEFRYAGGDRSIGVRIFDSSIWWSLWEDKMESRSSDPRWMHGNVGLDDLAHFLFGKTKREEKVLEEHDVVIPLPERGYPAKVRIEASTYTRERWRWWPILDRRLYATIELEKPPVIPGKGENSYDCGDDAIYSMSCSVGPHDSIEEAIGKYIAAVLKYRRKRSGSYVYPRES